MAKEIFIKPNLCTGCSTCALTCSLQNLGEFQPSKSFIKICKNDFEGQFYISFSSSCRGCCACALSCPTGALKVIDVGKNI